MKNISSSPLLVLESLTNDQLAAVTKEITDYLLKYAHFDNWSAGSISMDDKLPEKSQAVVDKIKTELVCNKS